MSSEREPLSPPVSPPPDEDDEYGAEGSDGGENLYTPAHGSDEKGDDSDSTTDEPYDDNGGNHVPSSPPTSIDNMNKNRPLSGEHSGDHHSAEGYRAPAVETEDEDDPEETRHTQREYFKSHYEGSSQWEDEEGEPAHARLSSPSLMTRVQSQTSSRKSPAPGPPLFPARPRQNTGSTKPGVGHQYIRRSPVSRGSSVSYDGQDRERDHRDDQKKPPLVLLHVTLLLLPGAEEIVLRHLTPTTIDRGVLVEHPRGDYNLLEELILDGLGLDEDYVEESAETEEPEEKTWEQALNISPVSPAKKAWQVRVYASNGLMTPGAWKRVWAEMERIDVEIWPRGYAVGKRNSLRTFGFGGHSRGTSASNISAILPEDADDYDVNDNRRKSYSSSFPRRSASSASELVASSAPVPNMPGRSQAPSAAPKSRKGRSRNASPSDQFGAYLGRFLTPRAVIIGSGINLLLFLYFTVFRFINVGAWKDSISSISLPSFGGRNGMGGIQVHDLDDGPFPAEGCVVSGVESDVAEGNGVEGEDGIVDGEKTEAGEDSKTVADPEIFDADGNVLVTEGTEGVDGQVEDGQDSAIGQEQAADGETYLVVDSEQESYDGARESGEQQPDPVAGEEVDHESAVAGEEVEVEERPKKSFFNYFGGSN
jgi:hypothetical protein